MTIRTSSVTKIKPNIRICGCSNQMWLEGSSLTLTKKPNNTTTIKVILIVQSIFLCFWFTKLLEKNSFFSTFSHFLKNLFIKNSTSPNIDDIKIKLVKTLSTILTPPKFHFTTANCFRIHLLTNHSRSDHKTDQSVIHVALMCLHISNRFSPLPSMNQCSM